MAQFIQILIFLVVGIILLWFGYTLFFSVGAISFGGGGKKTRSYLQPRGEGLPGDPQICPVCSAKLDSGDLVSSLAFPSLNGGKDRFMHIRGCIYCLRGSRDRICPVCSRMLYNNEILISRLFERSGRRSHVHVLGCTRCKGPPSGRD